MQMYATCILSNSSKMDFFKKNLKKNYHIYSKITKLHEIKSNIIMHDKWLKTEKHWTFGFSRVNTPNSQKKFLTLIAKGKK